MREDADIRFVGALATLLDGCFKVGRFRYGLDVFIDLLPLGGDTIILLLSLIPIVVAVRRKLPAPIITQMTLTVGSVYLIGLVPVLGSFAYLITRPNMRNYELLKSFTLS